MDFNRDDKIMGMDGYKNKQMMKKFIVFIGLLACVLAGCTREKNSLPFCNGISGRKEPK